MREIKFKGWNGKKMTREYTLYEMLSIQLENNGLKHNWLQYTGLKDKKGKEIYEGDIVEWEYLGFHISEIKQDLIGYYVENTGHIKDVSSKFRFDFPFQNLNVIGNIYENPELLDNK